MLIERVARILAALRICEALGFGPAKSDAIGLGLSIGLFAVFALLETFQIDQVPHGDLVRTQQKIHGAGAQNCHPPIRYARWLAQSSLLENLRINPHCQHQTDVSRCENNNLGACRSRVKMT
jgi:hypothetical protein